MEHFVQLEIWAILVAAPCIISWYLGEMYGAARIRRLVEDPRLSPGRSHTLRTAVTANSRSDPTKFSSPKDIESRGPTSSNVDTTIDRVERAVDAWENDIQQPVGKGHVATRSLQPAAEPARSRRRREAFEDMPSVAQLHAQAQLIRSVGRVWDDPELQDNLRKTDPISARVLQHYVGSINELARCNAQLEIEANSHLHEVTHDFVPGLPELPGMATRGLVLEKNR